MSIYLVIISTSIRCFAGENSVQMHTVFIKRLRMYTGCIQKKRTVISFMCILIHVYIVQINDEDDEDDDDVQLLLLM